MSGRLCARAPRRREIRRAGGDQQRSSPPSLASLASPSSLSSLPPPADAEKEALRQFNELRSSEIRSKRAEEAGVDPMRTRLHGLLTRLREGHDLGVYGVAWADDGIHLASCGHDASVVVWDVDAHEIKVSKRAVRRGG